MVHTHENAKSKEGISETENNGVRQKRKKINEKRYKTN